MKTDPKAAAARGPEPTKPLKKALKESEQVKVMVKESADELAAINVTLNEELADKGHLPEIESAIEKSEAVEAKVQEASDKLAIVNQALEVEVKERHLLELQLASVLEQQEETRHTSLHDPLTGLPNRELFNDRLALGLAQAKRHGRTLAVMFMDLDSFKAINDTYGHDAGDSVLRMVAERLKENTRIDDTVSRHGGDEFLYLLFEMKDDKHAAFIAEKIIKAIQAPCEICTDTLSVSPSIGIAVFPKDGKTADDLIKNADTAMYEAKRNKSGYAFFNNVAVPES